MRHILNHELTGHASVETAIGAVRLGAFDYITKPCKLTGIEVILLEPPNVMEGAYIIADGARSCRSIYRTISARCRRARRR